MKLEIYNNSTYENIKFICNNKEYSFSNLQKCFNIITDNKAHVKILIEDKNSFRFDLPAILTSSFTHKDSWCYIKCNLEFDIYGENKTGKIVINDTHETFKKRYTFESIKTDCFDLYVSNMLYWPTDTTEIQKKHKKYNLLVTSLFPLIMINIILCIIDRDVIFLFAGLFGFLVFSIPSIVDIKRFNRICTNSDIAQMVLSKRTQGTVLCVEEKD